MFYFFNLEKLKTQYFRIFRKLASKRICRRGFVFCAVVDFATCATNGWGIGIFFAILTAPFFGGAVLGVRFCLLYGPGVLSGWLRELREFFRKS